MFNLLYIQNNKKKIIIGIIIIILIVALVIWYRRRYKKSKGEMAILNSKKFKDELTRKGIDNKYLQAGIMGVVEEETGGKPISEFSYANTDSSRLKNIIFPSALKNYSIDQVNVLKQDNVKFFDIVYGNKFGNTSVGDGWKYRGRGYNGITFKNAYIQYGNELGIDLVNNPDKLNDENIATQALALYMKKNVPIAVSKGFITSLDKIKDIETGTEIAMRANSGKWDNAFYGTFIYSRYQYALEKAKKYV